MVRCELKQTIEVDLPITLCDEILKHPYLGQLAITWDN
jgi:hypothetical protein